MLTRSANASPVIHGFHYAPAHPSPRKSHPWNSAAATSAAAAAASAARRPSSSSSPPVTGASTPHSDALSGALSAASAADSASSSPTPSHVPLHACSRLPPRYVAVDAATQYSPMEPFDYAHETRYQHQHLSHHPDPTSSFSTQPPSQLPSKQSTPREQPPTPGPIAMEPGIEQGVDHAAPNGGAAPHSNGPAMQGGRPAPGARVTAPYAPTSAPTPASASAPAPAPGPASTTASASAPSSADARSSSLPSNQPTTSSSTAPASASAPPPPHSSSSAQPQQSHTASPQKRRISQQNDATTTESAPPADPHRQPSSSTADSKSGASKRARSEAAPVKMLPEQYELCDVEDMVVLIANMLGELIETNDALALKSGHLTRFHSRYRLSSPFGSFQIHLATCPFFFLLTLILFPSAEPPRASPCWTIYIAWQNMPRSFHPFSYPWSTTSTASAPCTPTLPSTH